MKNYVQVGLTLTLAAASDVVSGMVTMVGTLPVVPVTSALAGEDFEAQTQGVFEFPKTAANTTTLGAKIYLKADGTEVTTTATSNTLIGVATQVTVNGDETVQVRLNGVSV